MLNFKAICGGVGERCQKSRWPSIVSHRVNQIFYSCVSCYSWRHQVSAELGCTHKVDSSQIYRSGHLVSVLGWKEEGGGLRPWSPEGHAAPHPLPPASHTFTGGPAASHPGFHCAEEYWMTSLICEVYKEITQMNLGKKQTHRFREQTHGCSGEGKNRGKRQGVWDGRVHATIFKVDNQQGLAV